MVNIKLTTRERKQLRNLLHRYLRDLQGRENELTNDSISYYNRDAVQNAAYFLNII